MRPQTRLLAMQPQIRLTHRIRTHLLPNLLVLAVIIRDTAVRNRMHDVYALLAHLTRQCLRELPHRCAAGAVSCKLRTASQCAKRAGEDDGLVYLH
jgi:hypothetical protein